jgi:hypothetical protein
MAVTPQDCSSNSFDLVGTWSVGYARPASFIKLKIKNPGLANVNVKKVYITPNDLSLGQNISPLNDLVFYLPRSAHDYSLLTSVATEDYEPPVNDLAPIYGSTVFKESGYQLLNSFDLRSNGTSGDYFDLTILFAPFQVTTREYSSKLIIKFKKYDFGYYETFTIILKGKTFAIDKNEMDTKALTSQVFEVNGINVYDVFTIE